MGRYAIDVDLTMCIGDGFCCEEAPNTFGLDDEQLVFVFEIPEDTPEQVLNAAKSCPMDAITLIDEVTGRQVWPETA